MADAQFPSENMKFIVKSYVEFLDLEYPKDAGIFFEAFGRLKNGGTVRELFDTLIEAFPDKELEIGEFFAMLKEDD